MKQLPYTLLCLLLVASLSGCASTGDDDDKTWHELTVRAPSVEVLWKVTKLAFQRERFPVQNRFDSESHTTTTGWETSLAPFKGDGYRERAQVRYETAEPGYYLVEARVKRETNECLARPLDISYAKWKSDDDNGPRARVLLQRIRAYLGDTEGFEVGDKPTPFE